MLEILTEWLEVLERFPQWAFLVGFMLGLAGRHLIDLMDILLAVLRKYLLGDRRKQND